MKKNYLILLVSATISAQVGLEKDTIVQKTDSTYIIVSNKISKALKINFYDLPLENLKNRMGENLDGKDIYFYEDDIIGLGSCCVGVSEMVFYKYSTVAKNWLLYKTLYIEISAGILEDIAVQYYPYSIGINGEKYPANQKLHLEDSLKNKKISELIFDNEYNLLKYSKNLKKYNFKYSYEDLYLLVQNVPITKGTLDKYNNLAYFIAQTEEVDGKAIYLYNQILENFPDRVVTYLNLADSYWEIGKEDLAKGNYKKYIELMKLQKKNLNKIPKYVWERAK